MLDIHCHFLPGIDDGPRDWDVALRMVEAAARDGITHLVATPHSNDEFRFDRTAAAQLLRELQRRSAVEMSFSLGCDCRFSFENIQTTLWKPETFCISSTRYQLVEFSEFGIPSSTMSVLGRFIQAGIRPVITHPERNVLLSGNLPLLESMVALGCLVQVTANSLTGYWGETARKAAFTMIDAGLVHVVATDAHDLVRRPPVLSRARDVIRRRYSEELAETLCVETPRSIVAGQPVPDLPLAHQR